jgi:hypothetical protein
MFGNRYIVERGRCSRMVSAARRPCVLRRSKLSTRLCLVAHRSQQRSSPLIDRTSTPSILKRRPATAISTGKVVSLPVRLILALMVRGYQTHPRLVPEVRRARVVPVLPVWPPVRSLFLNNERTGYMLHLCFVRSRFPFS